MGSQSSNYPAVNLAAILMILYTGGMYNDMMISRRVGGRLSERYFLCYALKAARSHTQVCGTLEPLWCACFRRAN